MSPAPDPIRESFIAVLVGILEGTRIPGGSVAAWLAPVPTAVLAVTLIRPPDLARETLFAAVGLARLGQRSAIDQNLFEGSAANVPCGPTAYAALMAWAACRQARELLDLGFPEEAQRALLSATRLTERWPLPIAQRFLPQISALYAEADRVRARHLSDEVA